MLATAPRSMKPRPIVSITMANCGWPSTRRSTTRSSSHAERRHGRERRDSTPSQNGKPTSTTAVKAAKPPSIIRSPWAKLTVSVAL